MREENSQKNIFPEISLPSETICRESCKLIPHMLGCPQNIKKLSDYVTLFFKNVGTIGRLPNYSDINSKSEKRVLNFASKLCKNC